MDEEKMAYQSKSVVEVGKVFMNITPSEVLVALSLRQPPDESKTYQSNNQSKLEKKKNHSKDTINFGVEGLELDFQFCISQRDVIGFYSALSDQDYSI